MRVSDLVKTESERRAAADSLARTELADAVNTGIVNRADKSASVLLNRERDLARPYAGASGGIASRRADVAVPSANPPASSSRDARVQQGTVSPNLVNGRDAPSAGESGHAPTGVAAIGRVAVNRALRGTELEGVDTMAYAAYAGSKAAKRAVQKFSAKRTARATAQKVGTSAEGVASPVSSRAASRQGILRSVARPAEDAISDTLRGTELDGSVEIERGARLGFHASRYLGRKAGNSAASLQSKIQMKRHQMKAVMERAAAKKAAASTGAKAAGARVAGSAAASSAASATASGGGGAAAAAGGVGCLPIIIIFALILLIPLLIGAIGGVNSLEEDAGTLSGNEAVVAEYLLDKGLDEVQVAAIIGNMVQESGVNPSAVNSDSGAYGLCQWLGGRQDGLFALCDARGVPHSDINTQLDWFWMEFTMQVPGGWSNRTRYDDFMACTEDSQLETAVTIFARYFERCGEGEMNLENRLGNAQRVLDAMRTGGTGQDYASASGAQRAVVDAALNTPSPGKDYCAMWVSLAFYNAGMSYPGGNANDMYRDWCHSSDRSQLKVGMIVAVDNNGIGAGSTYGHVGIYIGDGNVMDNIGYVRTISLDAWIEENGKVSTVKWGWVFGRDLSREG